jgi:hypothetical protein
MAKMQLNVRIPNITRRQMDTIAGRENMTKGEIVTLAVDRLYAQLEREHKMDEKITSVRYGFHAADLLIGDDEMEMYDERLSAAKYADLVETKFREAYPEADIEVVYDFGAGGVLPYPLRAAVNDEIDHREIGTVQHIAGQVYEDFAWCVEKGE